LSFLCMIILSVDWSPPFQAGPPAGWSLFEPGPQRHGLPWTLGTSNRYRYRSISDIYTSLTAENGEAKPEQKHRDMLTEEHGQGEEFQWCSIIWTHLFYTAPIGKSRSISHLIRISWIASVSLFLFGRPCLDTWRGLTMVQALATYA